jgi:HSP20 family protein
MANNEFRWNWDDPRKEFWINRLEKFFKNGDQSGNNFEQMFKEFGSWAKHFASQMEGKMGEKVYEKTTDEVPMNIIETPTHFRLELAAPGLQKEDFKISVQDKTIHIMVDRQGQSLKAEESYLRQEFDFNKFKRSFTLPSEADTDQIEASYTQGLLVIVAAKTTQAKEIRIN